LQSLKNQLQNTFTDPKSVTKSYISAANASIKITIGQYRIANESQPRLKRGRSVNS